MRLFKQAAVARVTAWAVVPVLLWSVTAPSTAARNTRFARRKLSATLAGRNLNMTFKSKIDGSLQPLLIKVPNAYTPEKKWPLLVTLHGLGAPPLLANDVTSMVQIAPYGRGPVWYTGIGAQDVFEAVDAAKELFPIDEEKMYLCGFSMGGAGTFDLGLKYPDMWAACVPVCGRCNDVNLVQNAKHLAFWIHTGGQDDILPPVYSEEAYKRSRTLGFERWRYSEHEKMAHSFEIDWKKVEQWLSTQSRVANPKRVSFTLKDLKANTAYWVEVTGLNRYGSYGRIDAGIAGRTIKVKTNNISAYTLRLNNELVDLARQVEIRENDSTVFKGLLDGGRFDGGGKGKGGPVKRPGLCGPLWEIYSSPSILVYGTGGGNDSLVKAAKSCAEAFKDPQWMAKVSFKIIPDTALKGEEIANNNLVLFGNAGTNKILARISDRLPVRIRANTVVAGDKKYSGRNIGYVLIYPNPLNRDRYAAVFAGNTSDAINCFNRIWPQLTATPNGIDAGVFEISEDDSVRWRMAEIFGTNWDWQY
ncbi:MAG: hypothetical protein JSU94_09995 [Phycisphaerales bacterium]|nr:MAG: hypothetical protein JSU94_09995 [Phycisphaerales bacterium]